MPKVLNLHHLNPSDRRAIMDGLSRTVTYVGRPSKWGNPFMIGRDGSRERVISLYRAHMGSVAWHPMRADIEELRGQDLACWCAPEPCHADVLLEVANGTGTES